MLALPAGIAIYLATEPISMRNSIDGLCRYVETHFKEVDLYAGHLFVFLSRTRERAKILVFTRGGFAVYYKRLEKGRFRRPLVEAGALSCTLSPAELSSLLEGIDLSQAKRQSLWQGPCHETLDKRARTG
jgi:transposase